MLFLWLLILTGAHAMLGFEFLEPMNASVYPTASELQVRWRLNNVELPLPEFHVQLELYAVQPNGGQDRLIQTVDSMLSNSATYAWKLRNIVENPWGYRLRIRTVEDIRHEPGWSGVFYLQRLLSPDRALIVKTQNSHVFAMQQVMVEWQGSAVMPRFPYGVNLQLNNLAGECVWSIARNFSSSLSTHLSNNQYQWTVPLNLTVERYSKQAYVNLVIWGWDETKRKLVYGDSGPFLVDYNDITPLKLRFLTPSLNSQVRIGSEYPVVMQLSADEDPNDVTHRNVRLTLELIEQDGTHVATICDGLMIKSEEWTGGTFPVIWNVGHKSTRFASQQQIPLTAISDNVPVKSDELYRITYNAQYEMIEPGKLVEINGWSDLFSILASNETPKRPDLPGSATRCSVDPLLLVLSSSFLILINIII